MPVIPLQALFFYIIMLQNLSDEELVRMYEAASVVSEAMRVLQKSETNVVGEILKTSEEFLEWEHLPADDVYDTESHSQYYYHSHSKSKNGDSLHDDEHGHFHTFIRGKAMPKNISPVKLPDYDPKTDISEINTHIIGIGMNELGVPIRLFTVNRWVTGETWVKAEDVIKLLDQYEIDDTRPSWAVNLWITNLIILFRPLVKKLILERDAKIEAWKAQNPDVENIYEDRNFEVASYEDISLIGYIEELTAEIESRGM